MPAPKRKSAAKFAPPETARLWLMFPAKLIKKPVIWELGHKFDVITNVRQVSVADDIGIACLELEGAPGEVASGVRWLRKLGVNVEPVELGTVES
ncbi:MAG: NIL domain-containing protein [Verrucomicrobia bacterium]|nr:NIL domain-containing protein [Verrucomicrobiota bacterium]